jgi:hypothetical protein
VKPNEERHANRHGKDENDIFAKISQNDVAGSNFSMDNGSISPTQFRDQHVIVKDGEIGESSKEGVHKHNEDSNLNDLTEAVNYKNKVDFPAKIESKKN